MTDKRIPLETLRRVATLKAQGLDVEFIAERTGFALEYVRDVLAYLRRGGPTNRRGPPTTRPLTPEQKAELVSMILEGCSFGAAAKKFKTSRAAISGYVLRAQRRGELPKKRPRVRK